MRVTIVADKCRGKRGYEGAEVELPTSRFGLEDALQRAQVSEGDSYDLHHFIGCPEFLARYLLLAEEMKLEEVNLIAKKFVQMNDTQRQIYQGALMLRQEADIDTPISHREMINYAYNLDSFNIYPGVLDDYTLGMVALSSERYDIPEELMELIDERKVGESVRRADCGIFLPTGYVYPVSSTWQEVYDGVHLPEQQKERGMISLRLRGADKGQEETEGVWLELPASEQTIRQALTSVGETRLENCVFAEADSILPSLKYQLVGEEDIGKLNLLAERLEIFPNKETLLKYKAVLELECFPDIDRMLDITQNLDCYEYDPKLITATDHTVSLFRSAGIDLEDPAFSRFDFAGYGERRLEQKGIAPTPYGFIRRNDRLFVHEYTNPQKGLTMA